jgi:hypothetical protein
MNSKIEQQAAVDLFGNDAMNFLTDEELLSIHGGATNSGSGTSASSGGDSGGGDSGLVTHAGHIGTITGAGAAAGGAIGAAVGIPGGAAGIGAGAALGGAIGGALGFGLSVVHEVYEHRAVIADTANGVADFYATADVG